MKGKQNVYITGGSSGIGLALARHYAAAGVDLVLLARDQGKLDEAVAACRALATVADQDISAEPLDITDYQHLDESMQEIVQRRGMPDLVVLSAGVAVNGRFLDISAAEFDRVVDINLAGSREVVRAMLPGMLRRGSGQIALVSSMSGLVGLYGYTAYSASKFAVTGFSQALRQELFGTGVSVNLVCPPEVSTPMIAAEAATVLPQTRFLKDLVGTMKPELAARKIARGIRRNKAVIIPGVVANLLAATARHFPGLFNWSCALMLKWKFPRG